ncbi:MAG: DegT/DnrJ/EryC1/StrS family aminotransferase [Minisyncoccia bacterium]|jgi:perosamine synthetase
MKKISLFKAVPTGKELAAIKKVLDSGWWAMGPKVEEFEKTFAKKAGARYAVATNSCTAALDIAVRVVKLPNPVRVSAFTFVSSALAPLNIGKKIEFVDVDPKTLCTPEADIQVFYGGNESGKGIIYDMAHAAGVKHRGLVSCWSFHAVKNLPTGDGGMLTTNNKELYRRARAISWCGIDKSTYARSGSKYSWEYDIKEPGLKANMSDIIAAIGLCQLEKLDANNAYHKKVAGWYDKYLPEFIERRFKSSTWIYYPIFVPYRNELIKYLAENGVVTSVHFKPLYYYKIFNWHKKLPNTEFIYKRIISLPMHLKLTESDIRRVCDLIRKFYCQPAYNSFQ